mmetsp:Transcript_93155/g.272631  ORF Transcript_93155/g.272631 Transcript_93155/m.272631 type:complete len:215 (+) Transcript_93155:473-1117(+)
MEYLSSICLMIGSSHTSLAFFPSLLMASALTPSSSSLVTASRCFAMTASMSTVLPSRLLTEMSAPSSIRRWKICMFELTTDSARGWRWSQSTCRRRVFVREPLDFLPWALTISVRLSRACWRRAFGSSPRFSAVTLGATFFRFATPLAAWASCFLCACFDSCAGEVGPADFLGAADLAAAFPAGFFAFAGLLDSFSGSSLGGSFGSSIAEIAFI